MASSNVLFLQCILLICCMLVSDARVVANGGGNVASLVQQVYFDATSTKSKAALLARSATNPQLNERYSLAVAYLTTVVGRLDDAKKNLDPKNVFIQAQAALVPIYNIEDRFLFPAPPEPTDLLQRIKAVETDLNKLLDATK